MKRIVILIVVFFLSLDISAQASGGQIKRNRPSVNKKTVVKKNKDTQTITNKNRIIQNLLQNMVFVEEGAFYMGASTEQQGDYSEDERPTHRVALSSFYIAKYEVTQEEWETIMGNNPSEFIGRKRPVENVSWNDCQIFIRKLNSITGKKFRLPSEAEWEYAAKAFREYKYSGSLFINDVAWYCENSSSDTGTSVVGMKSPNPLGLYDMSGNVGEWCQDWYGKYTEVSKFNYKGASSGSFRVYRGGNWASPAKKCRVSSRSYGIADEANDFIGLRLVCDDLF